MFLEYYHRCKLENRGHFFRKDYWVHTTPPRRCNQTSISDETPKNQGPKRDLFQYKSTNAKQLKNCVMFKESFKLVAFTFVPFQCDISDGKGQMGKVRWPAVFPKIHFEINVNVGGFVLDGTARKNDCQPCRLPDRHMENKHKGSRSTRTSLSLACNPEYVIVRIIVHTTATVSTYDYYYQLYLSRIPTSPKGFSVGSCTSLVT